MITSINPARCQDCARSPTSQKKGTMGTTGLVRINGKRRGRRQRARADPARREAAAKSGRRKNGGGGHNATLSRKRQSRRNWLGWQPRRKIPSHGGVKRPRTWVRRARKYRRDRRKGGRGGDLEGRKKGPPRIRPPSRHQMLETVPECGLSRPKEQVGDLKGTAGVGKGNIRETKKVVGKRTKRDTAVGQKPPQPSPQRRTP